MLSEYCDANYTELKDILKRIPTKSLLYMDQDDLMDLFQPDGFRMGLMKILFNENLRDIKKNMEDEKKRKQEEIISEDQSILNLRDKIVSLRTEKTFLKFIRLQNFEDDIKRHISESIFDKIQILILSNNILTDSSDMEFLGKLLSIFKNLKILDLSNNKIKSDHNNKLREMLTQLDYMNLTNNPLCLQSFEDKTISFLSALNNEQLYKLIWIPLQWLSSRAWRGLFSVEQQKNIEKAHENYFRIIKKINETF